MCAVDRSVGGFLRGGNDEVAHATALHFRRQPLTTAGHRANSALDARGTTRLSGHHLTSLLHVFQLYGFPPDNIEGFWAAPHFRLKQNRVDETLDRRRLERTRRGESERMGDVYL